MPKKRKNKLKPQLIGCGFYIYLVKHLEQVWIAFPFDRISPLIDILLSANAETVNYHITKMYETLLTKKPAQLLPINAATKKCFF